MPMQSHRGTLFQHRAAPSDQPPLAPVAPVAPGAPSATNVPAAPIVLSQVPQGGGRLVIERHGGRTVVTSAALPPEVMQLANMAEETAFGLLGLIVVIVILGPFARMIARRMEKRPQTLATDDNARLLQQQLLQLQQSIDAMSVEVERISESQRFQSKLLHERHEA